MLTEELSEDHHYKDEILIQQQTLISALKQQILRLQKEINQIQKSQDEKEAQYQKALQQIEVLKEKNETLKQNNQSLLQTLQVFQREYIKRDYNNVLSLTSLNKAKNNSDGPFFMELIRNMKSRTYNQNQLQPKCEKSYLSQYYGYFFHSTVDQDETQLYQDMQSPKTVRPKKIKAFGKKNFFNQKYRHYFWFHIIENNLKITQDLYNFLADKISGNQQNQRSSTNTLIQMDLRRMDLKLDDDKSKSMKIQIKNCLQAFEVYRPDIGYIQGMSYLVWMFLIRMQRYQAFTSFSNKILTDPFVHSLYLFKQQNIKIIISFYEECLQIKKPKLSKHMKKLQVQSQLFIIEWAYTFFSRAFSLKLVSKIWDLWFSQDFNVFFKVAMVILEMLQPEILEQMQNDKVIQILRTKTHKLDENEFSKILQRQRLFEDLKLII